MGEGEGPKEACGLFGVWAPREEVSRLIYFALGPFSLYAVGTVTSDPEPAPQAPRKRVVSLQTDVFINTVMKTPHLGGAGAVAATGACAGAGGS